MLQRKKYQIKTEYHSFKKFKWEIAFTNLTALRNIIEQNISESRSKRRKTGQEKL